MTHKSPLKQKKPWTNDDSITSEVLQALKDGDQNAYEQVYLHWREPVVNLVYKFTRDIEDANDITQDVFAVLWSDRDKIEPEKKIRSLLFMLARNITFKLFRSRNMTKELLQYYIPEEVERITSHDIIAAKETVLVWKVLLDRLPRHVRDIYEMSVDEGLNIHEIAQRLNIKVETVKQKLSRARKFMSDALNVLAIVLCMGMRY